MKPTLTKLRARRALDTAARIFEIAPAAIVGSNKKRAVVVPARQALCAALYRTTTATVVDLGKFIGGRHHTTIMHHIEQAEQRAKADSAYAEAISQIAGACRS